MTTTPVIGTAEQQSMTTLETQPTEPKSECRPFQYSLRLLLAFTTLAAVGLSLLRWLQPSLGSSIPFVLLAGVYVVCALWAVAHATPPSHRPLQYAVWACLPRRPWVLVACVLIGMGLLHASVVGHTWHYKGDWWSEPGDIQVRGWPFIHSLEGSEYWVYGIVGNIVVCAMALACTSMFLYCHVHKRIESRQWTLEEMLLLFTAMALCFSFFVMDWEPSVDPLSHQLDCFHNLRDLPAYAVATIMVGVFCIGHAGCVAIYNCLRTCSCLMKVDRKT